MADQESGLFALIRRADAHLEHLGYREATRGEYMEIWRSFLRFAEGQGLPDGFNQELAARFQTS